MQFRPDVTAGTVITLISMVFLTGIAWGSLSIRVDGIDQRVSEFSHAEEKIEQRVDAKLNRIDNRLERIESLLMRSQ